HLGGKISVEPKVPLRTRDDLSMAYTPGVGRVSLALAERPQDVAKLTIKGNSVAVVTDGSAVLGLGNIGPGAALPVMEGKAALFNDDQHGTAIVVLAALTNALRCVHKGLSSVRVVVAGGGAAGTAIVDLLLAAGARHVLVWDREGILSPADASLNPAKLSLAH